MGGGEALIMTVLIGTSVCCPVVLFGALFGAMFGLPLLYNERIEAWTEGATPAEVYERLGEGAGTGGFMLRPASFMVEEVRVTPAPPAQVFEAASRLFGMGWGREVVAQDDTGLVLSMRFVRFVAMDLGWVGAMLVEPTEDGGSRVRYRFRTTYMWPVITFFLTIRLNLGVIPHVVPQGKPVRIRT